ncbi:toll/interleukin-1 receptor domain-containing protein [Streptomyces sp. NPDC051001]|uniref:toll/interleukin-1 receptor domain-containing protein n=1 Tax=Streptomyces sp. NPDC051001 TaxID=3155795 RepID=UPI00343D3627
MNGSPHFFFTSYSELPAKRSYVERFHLDVKEEVEGRLGLRTACDAFLDRLSMKSNDEWRYRIQEGACLTRTMLVLYSPRYFNSDWCAREWTAFTERVRRHREVHGGDGEHRVGVVWRRGPADLPEVVGNGQFLTGDHGSMYEEHGLFHLVPEKDEAPSQEYKDFVRKVGKKLADTLYRGIELPTLTLVEARELTPPFGPNQLRPVDVVVVHADSDRAWGVWAARELRKEPDIESVDTQAVSASAVGSVDRVRQTLYRAKKVLVLVSRTFFTHGDMSATALDRALSDGSTDWERMVPAFIDPSDIASLPTSFRQFEGEPALRDLDSDAAKALLVRLAHDTARRSGRPTGEGAVFPGRKAAGHSAHAPVARLVNALKGAVSINNSVLRAAWLEDTGLDTGVLDLGMPLDALLFALAELSARQKGSYEPLADALDILESGSAAAEQVRQVVKDLAHVPGADAGPGSPTEPAQPPPPAPGTS